jgi:hypothetical protein
MLLYNGNPEICDSTKWILFDLLYFSNTDKTYLKTGKKESEEILIK